MQFVVLPLFNEWSRFCPTELSRTMLQNIKLNKEEWDTIIQQTKEVCSLVSKFVAFFVFSCIKQLKSFRLQVQSID